jgi:hypothetical protein
MDIRQQSLHCFRDLPKTSGGGVLGRYLKQRRVDIGWFLGMPSESTLWPCPFQFLLYSARGLLRFGESRCLHVQGWSVQAEESVQFMARLHGRLGGDITHKTTRSEESMLSQLWSWRVLSSRIWRHIVRWKYKKFWEEFAYFPLIWHGPHRKRYVQQLFYCCVCIRCRGNAFNGRHRLMGGIYKVRRWDPFRCHNMHTKFRKEWFRHSKVDSGRYIDAQTARRSHRHNFIFWK